LFVQQTVVPALTVRLLGAKVKSSMSTSVAPVGQVVSLGVGACEAPIRWRRGADERADRDRERHGG
jgi:hypothetical protein